MSKEEKEYPREWEHFQFEQFRTAIGDDWVAIQTSRLKVPGGWLVEKTTMFKSSVASTIQFVADSDHKLWNLGKKADLTLMKEGGKEQIKK